MSRQPIPPSLYCTIRQVMPPLTERSSRLAAEAVASVTTCGRPGGIARVLTLEPGSGAEPSSEKVRPPFAEAKTVFPRLPAAPFPVHKSSTRVVVPAARLLAMEGAPRMGGHWKAGSLCQYRRSVVAHRLGGNPAQPARP